MERVTIHCRCGECIVGEEVNNDGEKKIYCHSQVSYKSHESFCDVGRKKVVQENGTFEPEFYRRCPHCTAILNHMGNDVKYCTQCGTKVDTKNMASGLLITYDEEGLADVVKEMFLLMKVEDVERSIILLEGKERNFERNMLNHLLRLFKDTLAK